MLLPSSSSEMRPSPSVTKHAEHPRPTSGSVTPSLKSFALPDDLLRVNAFLKAHAEELRRGLSRIRVLEESVAEAGTARVAAEAEATRAQDNELRDVSRAEQCRAGWHNMRRAKSRLQGAVDARALRLSVRVAGGAGAIVKTEKRVVNVRFSYKQRVFVEHFIVLDLDDKFDVVMGMPWLVRHHPVIDWKKRTLVRFGRDSGTESDGPVTAARAPAAGLHDEAPCDQAGLDIARPQTGSAGERLSTAGPGPEEQLCGAGLRTTRRRRKRRTLRKSRHDWKRFTRNLHDGCIEQVCVLSNSERTESKSEELRQLFMGSTTESEDTLRAKTKRKRFEEQGWDSLKSSPYYELLREYKDVLPEDIPAELPQDKGIQHEIDLVPGTKYCVTRQWPLPRQQVKAIDDFFESRRKAGQVRESKSPHSAPTFCVKKPQGGWRIVHAYNKLNDATVPAQTPIPRKDVIVDSMAGSTVYSALD
ncbi:reverse transcriptase [Phytophthora cinnamomi]|uniref:reverse transcriptase n=1 Tax=Phytophthora cinnamomi TaxID=4785 RepID=UPI003559ECEA|nr:reverse transcriptase [Phytophthora cinnamomi]